VTWYLSGSACFGINPDVVFRAMPLYATTIFFASRINSLAFIATPCFKPYRNTYLIRKALKNQAPEQILGTLSQRLEAQLEKSIIEPAKLLSNLLFSHFSEFIKISDPLIRKNY